MINYNVDSDGIAYVFTESGMMNMGANTTEVYRVDPATGESLFYSTTMMRHSSRAAIDLKTHVVYCSSSSDFNLSQLMSFDIVTRVAKIVQVVTGDSLDLAVASPQIPLTRVRAVRP